MRRIPLGALHYEFSRHTEPRLRVEPGETIVVETEDAFSGQIRTDADRRNKVAMPYSNPLTGPVSVAGAEPGDTLRVAIGPIRPRLGQCFTRTGVAGMLSEWLGDDCPHGTHVCPIRDGLIHWGDGLTIPYEPMLGCLGTAPDWGVPSTIPAGPHGGNMDIVEVRPGSVVMLPVWVPGGLLYVGDAHAAMGHGELSASGLEMPAEAELTLDVVKGKRLAWPRIETPDEIMVVVSGSPMERSVARAYSELILWMESDHGWDRWRAYDLLTHVGRLSVGYFGIGTVAAKVAKRYLAGAVDRGE